MYLHNLKRQCLFLDEKKLVPNGAHGNVGVSAAATITRDDHRETNIAVPVDTNEATTETAIDNVKVETFGAGRQPHPSETMAAAPPPSALEAGAAVGALLKQLSVPPASSIDDHDLHGSHVEEGTEIERKEKKRSGYAYVCIVIDVNKHLHMC